MPTSSEARPRNLAVPLRIKTVVADAHPIAAIGAQRCLEEHGFDVCSIVGDVRSLHSVVELSRPGLIVIETTIGEHRDTLGAVADLVERHSCRILAITTDISLTPVRALLESGSLGVVPRTVSADALVAAARAVAAGEQHIHPHIVAGMIDAMRGRNMKDEHPVLTVRELDVLTLIADGCSNVAIAARLGLSVATIKTHVERLLRRLSVADRAQAVATAMRLGVLR